MEDLPDRINLEAPNQQRGFRETSHAVRSFTKGRPGQDYCCDEVGKLVSLSARIEGVGVRPG
jgi:hypothetical protein